MRGKESKSDGKEREKEKDAEKCREERKCELNVNDVIFLPSISLSLFYLKLFLNHFLNQISSCFLGEF